MVPISTALLTLSTEVLAHPSHDHSHWSSPVIHAIFAAGVWAYHLYRQKSQQYLSVFLRNSETLINPIKPLS